MFINLTNHPSSNWSEKQIAEAEKYGEITDIPFPLVDPEIEDAELDALVEEYYQKIMAFDHPVVMVQGEFVFSFRLINRLKAAGIKALASCSRRVTTEEYVNNQSIKKSVFEFVRFREF